MKVLHLLSGGGLGGIEILCKEIAKVSKLENEFVFLFSGGKIADELEKEGHVVYRFYRRNGRLNSILQLINQVKRQKYDVIIAHHGSLSIFLYYLILMVRFPKKIYIKYLHSVFDPRFYYKGQIFHDRLMNWALNRIFATSDNIVAVSEYVRESFVKVFPCQPERISVIYNGILVKDKNQRYIPIRHSLLYIGRLEEEKGMASLIEAAKILKKENKWDFCMTVVGTGSYKEYMERLIQIENLQDWIALKEGTLEKDDYYCRSECFLYPSVCQEAFGISLVEAMDYGLICVASNVGGIPEIITHGQNGFLFPAGDAMALVSCLHQVFAMNETERANIRCNARLSAQRYSIEQTVRELENLYQKRG